MKKIAILLVAVMAAFCANAQTQKTCNKAEKCQKVEAKADCKKACAAKELKCKEAKADCKKACPASKADCKKPCAKAD